MHSDISIGKTKLKFLHRPLTSFGKDKSARQTWRRSETQVRKKKAVGKIERWWEIAFGTLSFKHTEGLNKHKANTSQNNGCHLCSAVPQGSLEAYQKFRCEKISKSRQDFLKDSLSTITKLAMHRHSKAECAC